MTMTLAQVVETLPDISRQMSALKYAIKSSQSDMSNGAQNADSYLADFHEDKDPGSFTFELSTEGQAETLENQMRLWVAVAKNRFLFGKTPSVDSLTADERADIFDQMLLDARDPAKAFTTWGVSSLTNDIADLDAYFVSDVEVKVGSSSLYAFLDPASQTESGEYRLVLCWVLAEKRIAVGFP